MQFAVDVITRTKDRPSFLRRCLDDLLAQDFDNYRWLLINDGGDPEPVRAIAEKAAMRGVSVKFESLDASVGMEAAANRAAGLGDAPLMVVHDDDDTWAPTFLSKMVEALKDEAYIGAVCWSQEVRERVESERAIRELSRGRSEFCPHTVGIASLVLRNRFPPIAFMFRRSAYEQCGKFNQDLQVLGDWDFNLRLIERGDFIVVPELLANYHIRVQGSKAANSVVAGRGDHLATTTLIQNRYIRQDLQTGRFGLGALMAIAVMVEETAARQGLSERWGRFKKLVTSL